MKGALVTLQHIMRRGSFPCVVSCWMAPPFDREHPILYLSHSLSMSFAQHIIGRQLQALPKARSIPSIRGPTRATLLSTFPAFPVNRLAHLPAKPKIEARGDLSRAKFREEQLGLLAGFWVCSLVGFGCMYGVALMLEERTDQENETGASVYRPWV